MKKGLFSILLVVLFTVIALFLAEGALRFLGYTSWTPPPRSTYLLSNNGPFFVPNNTTGYQCHPGSFSLSLNNQITFEVTHDSASHRISHTTHIDAVPEVWILGGSFTYGWGLNDTQVFSWKLQERLTHLNMVNFGVPGYGTLQSFLQFKEALKKEESPKYVILNYASFHDQRNTCSRFWLKAISTQSVLENISFPTLRKDDSGKWALTFVPNKYEEFPFMKRSAFIHLLETNFNHWEEAYLESKNASLYLIEQFQKICDRDKITFLVAGIQNTPSTQQALNTYQQAGIQTIMIAPEPDDEKYTLAPVDPHPNEAAHTIFSHELEHWILNQEEFVLGN